MQDEAPVQCFPYTRVLEIFKSIGLSSFKRRLRREDFKTACGLMRGSCWEIVYHVHGIMNANEFPGYPFLLTTNCALHHFMISKVFAKGFTSRTSGNIKLFEKIFMAPSYSPIIRKFIREYYCDDGKATNLLTSEKIWELIEFIFNKYDIEMVKDSNILDERGEVIFQNANCIMHSSKFNICCFEIPPFSNESVNDWNNAFFIPIIMLYYNISKKAYGNTCLSIIKHANNISIYSGYMNFRLHYGTDYCMDCSNELGFGEILGAIIQYCSTIKRTKSKDFLKDRFDRFEINLWKSNYYRLQQEITKIMNAEKMRERELRKNFHSLKI